MWILGLLILLLLWWWWWNEMRYVAPVKARLFSSSNTKLPPGHLGFPLFGEMLVFHWYFNILRRPDDFITSKKLKYGDNIGAYRSYLFGCPTIIACSPGLCKLVLQSGDVFIPSWPNPEIMGLNSVITMHGAQHKLIKTFLIKLLNGPHALARIALHIQPTIVASLHSWSKLGEICTYDEVKKMTFEYLRKYFLHCELGLETGSFLKLLYGVNEGVRAEPLPFLGTASYHANQCRKKIDKILRDELEKRKQEKMNSTKDTNNDLMDCLMQMKDKEGNGLSDKEVVDNIFSVIQTSNLDITYAMLWSMYFLAKSPHVLQKLREENLNMSTKKKGGYITYEDMLELEYTLKVVEEIIRRANISAFLFRRVTDDIEFKGFIIPKGWNVMVFPRYLHTDPKNFENPLCFNPDRWNTCPKNGTYLPFGGGAKSCPGSMMARINLAIFIHHLSVGYKWEMLNPDVPIKYLSHPKPADGLQISIGKI